MVSHLKAPILNCFYQLLWFYFLTDSEFRCLAMLAKPYLVFGPTLILQIPNQLHCIQRVHIKCLVLSWGLESCQFSLIKSSILFINHWSIVFRSTFVYLQPSLLHMF